MTDNLLPSALTAPLFSSVAMRAILDDRARLQRMLDFAAALARAEASIGVIPASAVSDIAGACRAERYDIAAVAQAAMAAGNVAIPSIAALTAEVGKRSPDSAGYVNWGAAVQDMVDTALALELRAAIDALIVDLDRAVKAFTSLAGRHRRTMVATRVMLEQTLPTTFGLKLAGYAAALARSRERLRRVRREALALQFGGAAGTLATFGEQGLEVAARLAALLDLPNPDAPWHSHRDRLADVASAFAILAGTCGKITRDVALLMQSEIREVSQRPAEGGAAPLPAHRHLAGAALAAAAMAPGLAATILAAQFQEHELGVGQAEWAAFSALMLTTSGAVQAAVDIAEGLEVDVERMKANLEATGGLVFAEAVSFALAAKLGATQAQTLTDELVRKAAADKRPLLAVLAADERVKAQLDSAAIERLFTPTSYQNSAQNFIDRLVASTQFRHARRLVDAMPQPPEAKPVTAAAARAVETAKPAPEPIPSAAPTKPDPVAAPSPAAPPPAEQPSALIEAFTRVADAADQMSAQPAPDRERKPA